MCHFINKACQETFYQILRIHDIISTIQGTKYPTDMAYFTAYFFLIYFIFLEQF